MYNNSNQKHSNQHSVSRYQLKQKLNGMERVDISSFDQSKNQTSKCNYSPILSGNSIFPSVDAPTLQFGNDSQKKPSLNANRIQKIQKFQPIQKRKYFQDPTQRNKKSRERQLQEQNKKLQKRLQQAQIQLQQLLRISQQKNHLELKIKSYQAYAKKREELIHQQKQQIKMLKDRQIRISKQKEQILKEYNQSMILNNHSTVSGVSSYFIQDVSSFCPEMLSPQQTVLLLSKLLKKVSKSSKMIRQLTQEGSVKQILIKMSKK